MFLQEKSFIEDTVRGQSQEPVPAFDGNFVDDVMNHLFETEEGNNGGLLSLNIQRGRGWAEQEPSICAGTGYPVPVFQIPVPAEPVPDIWQEKSRKISNSLNWFQRVTFTFQKNISRNKIFLLIFLIVETSMPVIPVAQRQKQDIPYSHKYLVSFPLNP